MSSSTNVIAETPSGFANIVVNDIRDLFEFSQLLQDPFRFVFRGQCNASWELETRVERMVPQTYKKIVGLQKCEQEILAQFQRRAHHYLRISDIPNLSSDLEWLALIQHYGGPTRLLDFTRSIFIATYFAIGGINRNQEAAVWAVNLDFMSQNATHFKSQNTEGVTSALTQLQNWRNEEYLYKGELTQEFWMAASLYRLLSITATVSVEPFRQNRRLLQQQGLFIAPLNINARFIENLNAMFHPHPVINLNAASITMDQAGRLDDYSVIRMVIPRSRYKVIREELDRMNISTETVFPDLDGEARALENILIRNVFVDDRI